MRITKITPLLMSFVLVLLTACGGETPATGGSATSAPAAGAAATAPAAAAPTSGAASATAAPAATTAAAPAATTAGAAGGAKTFALVAKNLGNPYIDTVNNGAQEAAKELSVTVTYQGPATADVQQQIQIINSLAAQNVSGMAIMANDADALVPVGKQIMDQNIPVISVDSQIAVGGRLFHVSQADAESIGRSEIQLMSKLIGGKGKIAILSATSTAPNQNQWIEFMKDELKKPEFAGLELVATVYGDDQDEKSYNEAQGLMRTYPDLKGIIAPTTVGIAASGRAVTDAKKIGQVIVSGLGTPNQMREYVKNGASPAFALWNPADLGYLAIYGLNAIATGKIKGQEGDKFTAGRLGDYTVGKDGIVILGPPTVFDKDNIDKFNF